MASSIWICFMYIWHVVYKTCDYGKPLLQKSSTDRNKNTFISDLVMMQKYNLYGWLNSKLSHTNWCVIWILFPSFHIFCSWVKCAIFTWNLWHSAESLSGKCLIRSRTFASAVIALLEYRRPWHGNWGFLVRVNDFLCSITGNTDIILDLSLSIHDVLDISFVRTRLSSSILKHIFICENLLFP